MKTRLIAGVIAVVLAAVGAVVLVSYVRGADARAMAGLDTVSVLVAAEPIAEGTQSADLAALVATKQLPANVVLPNAVTSLDQLAGEVALVPLDAGEQLLASKFGAKPSANPDAVAIPPEMQQVTVLLDLQRAMGGIIRPGDTVGIFLSTKEPDQVARTHLTAQKVLVTKVQRPAAQNTGTSGTGATSSGTDTVVATSGSATPTAPAALTDSVLVTVATKAPMAEQIVFAATYGSVWLSNEPLTADGTGTQVIDGTLVFK
jgi:pilus assembly protein CpaB